MSLCVYANVYKYLTYFYLFHSFEIHFQYVGFLFSNDVSSGGIGGAGYVASWGRGGGGRGQIGNHFFEFAFKLYKLKKLIKIIKIHYRRI